MGRDRDGHVRNLEPLARALCENSSDISLDMITGEDIMNCLEKSDGHTFHYCDGNKENGWPGIKHLLKRKKQSNVVRTRTIEEISSGDDASQGTQPTVSSLESWGLGEDSDY